MTTASKVEAIIFDLHGVLIDADALVPQYARAQARILSNRYGGAQEVWEAAELRMNGQYRTYLHGLDLTGPAGACNLLQARARMIRAVFEFAGIALPEEDVFDLVEKLPYEVARECNAAFPEASEALAKLKQAGLRLFVASESITAHSRGCLEGNRIAPFIEEVFGPDTVGWGRKGTEYFSALLRSKSLDAQQCLVVDDNASGIIPPLSLGARAVLVDRTGRDDRPLKAEARTQATAVVRNLRELAELVIVDSR